MITESAPKTEAGLEIEEILKRLKGYYPNFTTDVEENVLLRELYLAITYLRGMIDDRNRQPVSAKPVKPTAEDEDRLEELKKRMDAVENDLTDMDSSLSRIEENVPKFRQDIEELKEADDGFESDIELLISENERQLELIDKESTNIRLKLDELREADANFNTEIDEYLEAVSGDLEDMNKTLDAVDSDAINTDLAALEAEDIVIKESIDTNYNVIRNKIDEANSAIEEVEIDEHRQAIINLKEEDTRIESKITDTSEELNGELEVIKVDDGIIAEEMENIKESMDGIDEKILIGSLVPEEGKVPLGMDDGYIADGWIKPTDTHTGA